ncbi:DUF4262 domain-containing protein [Mycobacterium avium subsp. hominissuis]|uniref:DUF4262 domain-containing protein n=1 Tax=Mycobacterium avium TaxID=1764 RepID=UPI002664EAA8|nr:DUF4262 domain-containing protein [Mycobacterium avium]MDO2394781.1 DUF4262 domain-containing protein [Mycobacterium avium subsp. hominissuis]
MGIQKPQRSEASAFRAEVLADTRAKIAAHGWTVIAVFPTADDPGPSFAYTVGLSERGLPELSVYGLPGRVAHSLLNEVARRMVASAVGLATGERVEGVLADDMALVAVAMSDARELNLVREIYGSVAAAVQVVWPDGAGVLPWEKGSRVTEDDQPVRGCPPQARPLYHASRLPVTTAQELADLIGDQPRRSLLDSDGAEPQEDNNIRAGWAARALVAYAQHVGGASLSEEIEVAAGDLLGDLRHLFDALGVDWDAAVEASGGHYRAEIFGEL